jgi:hypothetical protein
MREGGIITTNEWRNMIGMNQVRGEEGDYLIIPGGYSRLDQIDNQGNRQENAAAESEEQTDITEQLEDALKVATDRIHHNSIKQVQRWKTQDPESVMEKAPEFAAKQRDRVHEAVKPIYAIAEAAGYEVLSIEQQYFDYLSSLDYHGWFALSECAPVNYQLRKKKCSS